VDSNPRDVLACSIVPQPTTPPRAAMLRSHVEWSGLPPNLKYYPEIFMNGLRKTTVNCSPTADVSAEIANGHAPHTDWARLLSTLCFSLYRVSHYNISLIRTFIMKRASLVWIVFRTLTCHPKSLPNRNQHVWIKTEIKAASPSDFALPSALLCSCIIFCRLSSNSFHSHFLMLQYDLHWL
jgi:hypothetical protein